MKARRVARGLVAAVVAGPPFTCRRTAGADAGATPAAASPDAGDPQAYKPVTAERLLKPDPADWLMVRRTYDGWGYSPLDQINTGNVSKLRPVWSFSTGMTSGHEAPAIVNNGVMFVSTPANQVIAIDAKDRQAVVALPARVERGRDRAASHEPRRRAVRRQSLSRRERSGPRRARRADRQGSLDGRSRAKRERLLHVARAARCRRQGDDWHVGRRDGHPRVRRGVRRRDRQ